MNGTPEAKTTMPSKEELMRKIMFLLNAPAQRLATVLNASNRTKCVGDCGRGVSLPKGGQLSPNLRYICEECSPDQSAEDAQRSEKEKQRQEKSKEASARWRKNKKEWAAEYKRRYRKGDRREQFRAVPVDSDRAHRAWDWFCKMEEFGFACSSCGRSLSLKTAIRWREDATYVPVCAKCRGKKAAEERWRKEKAAGIRYIRERNGKVE